MTEGQKLESWNKRAAALTQQIVNQDLNHATELSLKPHLYTKSELILEVQRLKALAAALRTERDLARNDLAIIRKNISRMVTACK